MVVVVIIMILTVGILTVGAYVKKKAQIDETKNYIQILVSALQEYKNYHEGNFSGFPGNWNDFFTWLDEAPNCRKILDKIPPEKRIVDGDGVIVAVRDAWGTEMRYIDNDPGNFPTIRSAGPDKEFNNADDITSDKL